MKILKILSEAWRMERVKIQKQKMTLGVESQKLISRRFYVWGIRRPEPLLELFIIWKTWFILALQMIGLRAPESLADQKEPG